LPEIRQDGEARHGLNGAYITSTGAFLPGPPIGNDEIEDVLGYVEGRSSRLKARILKSNGIQTRHYAIDRSQRTTHSNAQMAVAAAKQCLDASPVPVRSIGMLSCATTQGDMVVPGFGSMVQAGLGIPAVELLTAHGICSSSVMAIKGAASLLRLGDHRSALVVVSELASRLLKGSRYEAAGGFEAIDFNSEFLRWMLSDGAGAWLLESAPRGRCLRIDWIRTFSHADAFPVCMGIGTPADTADLRTWQDYPTYAEAEAAGALLIRQDVRLLEQMVKLGVDGALRLIEEGVLTMKDVDHFLCHYSSHHFKGKIADLLEMSGASIPQEKWFTNLYTRGNTGAASILIMLDEFLRGGRAKAGERILCMVPESGRFNTAYMHFTVIEA
jgi:3-oxoacyl-[acyl-carrier-protein] synthase-3